MTTLTISIVTHRVDQALFLELLKNLSRASARAIDNGVLKDVKLIIVDNADDYEFLLQSTSEIITFETCIIRNSKNIGFGRAHNLALQQCESDMHLLLNPDAVLQQDALIIGCNHLLSNKETVMVGPYAMHPNGSRAYLCKRYPSILDLLLRGFAPVWMKRIFRKRLGRYECSDYPDDRITKNILILSGCFMLAKTKSLAAAHGFSSDYFLYFEDFDLSLKMGRLGSIDYLPNMRIVHGGGGAAQKGLYHIMLFVRSAFTFYTKNGWKFF